LTLLQRRLKYSNAKPEFSEEQVWNVLENFYFPFTEELEQSISAASALFKIKQSGHFVSKNDNQDDGIPLRHVQRKTTDFGYIDYIRNARLIFFYYELTSPKEKKVAHLSINIDLKIIFEKDGYRISCLNDKKFEYEQYPTQEELDTAIAQYKADILNKIENAVKNISQ